MKILDLSAGRRGVWIAKDHPGAVFVDIRPEVEPTIVADSRNLPPEIGENYDLVVFDPPHVNFGKNANMSRDYGHHTTAEIRELVRKTAAEAHRVTRPEALMSFKWNDHDQPLARMLALMAPWWEPLFGHIVAQRAKHVCMTQWVMLKRI